MFIQLFSKYLVEKNVITDDQRREIISKQFTTRAKMGTIAVAEKLLTEEQADELNQLQMQMDKRFGDLAVEKGYLTDDDITKILKKQGNPYILFVQLIDDVAGISNSDVEKYLKDYQTSHGFTDHEIETLKIDDIDSLLTIIAPASNSYVTDVVGLVLRNLTRFVSADFYVGKIKRVESYEYAKLAGQTVAGDHTLEVAFLEQPGQKGLDKLASLFSKEEYEPDSDHIYDTVGEFTNCINGLYATLLSDQDEEVDMLPPVAYKNDKITGKGYVLPITLAEEDLELFVAFDSDVKLGDAPLQLDIVKNAGVTPKADGKETVLIVDDSRMSRMVLRNILEEMGYQIIGEAVDGEEGVHEYKRLSPDIVTLDVTMPKLDGIEALKQIMDYKPDATAIMITAAGQQKRIIEALKIGAKKFVTKPFDKTDIVKNFEGL